MKLNIALAVLLLLIVSSFANESRFITLTCTNQNNLPSIEILEGETAEIVAAIGSGGYAVPSRIEKGGTNFTGYPPTGNVPRGTVVAGPAVIRSEAVYLPTLVTIQITPTTYDVNKTLILPPGTNQVYVALESSTNLVNWSDSTNGVFGSPDTARFFRIRMSKQTP